ncbi:hypothetical protein [Kaarinaea lacus]
MPHPLLLQALLLLGILCFPGCDTSNSDQYPAAVLNDKETLEKLASAYETVSGTIPVSPINLRPSARKKFVEQVFTEAGYNYSTTLYALSKVPSYAVTQYHKDLKQLLFLPHYKVEFDEIKDIYTNEEINAIETININIK